MPDVESLMQAWDGVTGEVLRGVRPDASFMPQARRAAARHSRALYENLVESMHVVFSTYLVKNNPFLRKGEVAAAIFGTTHGRRRYVA